MYYEVYVDTLFLVNFVMNLYLLMLTNKSVGGTVTRLRMIIAAALGAVIYIIGLAIAFLPPIPRLVIQTAAASLLMIKIAFKPRTPVGYIKILETLLGYSFFAGGALYILSGYMEEMADYSLGIAFVMGAGGLIFMFCTYLIERKKNDQDICIVTLYNKDRTVTVKGLVDTGNGLTEPIGNKPVSVTNREVLYKLWPEGLPEFFRVIPYHSIGKNGFMKGYQVERMVVERSGIPATYEMVYIAAGEQEVSGKGNYGIILNPRVLLPEVKTWGNGGKDGIKSGNAGTDVFPIDSEGEECALSKTGGYPLHRRQ